jgi:thiamine biosynthesis protein ThiS
MRVTVNGEKIDIADGSTVVDLLEKLQISRDRVAVEANLEIVPKASYDSRILTAEDTIEIVHFVGGG